MTKTFDSRIINAGVGGNNSRALLERIVRDVFSYYPDLMILMVGTNDALNSGALVPLEEYAANLDALVARTLQADCKVLLATVAPFDLPALLARHQIESYGGFHPSERLAAINEAIKSCARKRGVPLADVNTVLSVLGNIGEDATCLLRNTANAGMADGVHPTAGGYALIADVIYQTILDHNLPASKVVCFGDSITFGPRMEGEGSAIGLTYPARLAALLHRAGQADFHGTPRYEEENRERPATHRDDGIVFQIDIPAEISCAGRNLTNPAASRIHQY